MHTGIRCIGYKILLTLAVNAAALVCMPTHGAGWNMLSTYVYESESSCPEQSQVERLAAGEGVLVSAPKPYGFGGHCVWYQLLSDGSIARQGLLMGTDTDDVVDIGGIAVDGSTCLIALPDYYDERVLVYNLSGSGDIESVSTLRPWSGSDDQFFGWEGSVAVSGDVVAIGASYDNPSGYASGSVWIFERNGSGQWTNRQRLTGTYHSSFGYSVSLFGDQLLVVANGYYPTDDSFANLYRRGEGGGWTLVTTISEAGIGRISRGCIGDKAILLRGGNYGWSGARILEDSSIGEFVTLSSGSGTSQGASVGSNFVVVGSRVYGLSEEGGFVDDGVLTIEDPTPNDPGDSFATNGTVPDIFSDGSIAMGAVYSWSDEWSTCSTSSISVFARSCVGDTNQDSIVGVTDLLEVLSYWGDSGNTVADIDGSGVVDSSDLELCIEHWGFCDA